MNRQFFWGGVGTCLLSTFACAPALAQSMRAQDGDVLEEVVVVSRKRAENIMEVPTAISVVDEQFIKSNLANSVTDLGYGMTGVLLDSGNGGSSFIHVSIRGVAGLQEPTGVRSGIGFFVDGVNVFNQTAFNAPLLDVERVEVLKGPQPAAFGRSVLGGAINLISRKPPRDLRVEGDLTMGNYELRQARLSVGGPIVDDKLFVNLSGLTLEHDGYLENVAPNGLDAQAPEMIVAKLNLEYLPGDNFSIHFIQDYFKDDGFYGPRDCVFAGCAPGTQYDRKVNSANGRHLDTSAESASTYLKADYQLKSGASIVGITGYRYNNSAQQFDITDTGAGSSFADFKDNGSWQFSQELRFVSPDEGKLRYLGGLLYTIEDVDFSIPFINPFDAPQPSFPGLTQDLILDDRMLKTSDIYSAFASLGYDITARLNLDVGARVTHEKTEARSRQYVINDAGLGDQGAADLFDGFELFDVTRSDSWDNFEGQVALGYDITDNVMLYGRVSQGKKSGGFTQLIVFGNSARHDPGFGPEKLLAYEAGIKAELMESRLRLSAALHQSDYDDIQVRFSTVETQGIRIIQNAGEARSRGIELEAAIVPNEHLSISAGLSVQESEYTRAVPRLNIREGNSFPFTPEVIADLTVSADYPVSAAVDWFGGVTAGYRSKSFHDSQNQFTQDPNTIVNVKTGVRFMEDRWTVALWAKNLTDKTVTTFAFFPGSERYSLNAPRTYGLELGFEF